jgi:hypothetical protein
MLFIFFEKSKFKKPYIFSGLPLGVGVSDVCMLEVVKNMNAVTQNADPNRAFIHFDEERNGFVLG